MAHEISRKRMNQFAAKLTHEVAEEIKFAVKYGDVIAIDNVLKPIMNSFRNSALEKPDKVEYKQLSHFYRCYVERVQRRYPHFEFHRCPVCRAKLKTRRCLGCDITEGKISE